jgi:Protein of unknown function (DUF3159)
LNSADRAAATVEQVVRAQLTTALGGLRGVVETALPTIGFTVCYVVSGELRPSLVVGIASAAVLVLLRVARRSSLRFVLNSLFGILIAAVFAARSGRAQDAFLPGILYNGGYAVAMIASIAARWPILGFVVGTATGDPTGWRSDPALVKLCSRLTWLLVLPCALRFVVQFPLYQAGAVGALGTAKVVMGWPLQVGSFAAMGALLARGRTPLDAGTAAASHRD